MKNAKCKMQNANINNLLIMSYVFNVMHFFSLADFTL